MPYVATVSITENDRQYIKDNHISLSRFLREKLAEDRTTHPNKEKE